MPDIHCLVVAFLAGWTAASVPFALVIGRLMHVGKGE